MSQRLKKIVLGGWERTPETYYRDLREPPTDIIMGLKKKTAKIHSTEGRKGKRFTFLEPPWKTAHGAPSLPRPVRIIFIFPY